MAMRAPLDDPDGILDGTDPVPETPLAKYGVVLEPGEKVDTPWMPGDELILPTESRPRITSGTQAMAAFGGLTPEEVALALRAVPAARGEPTEVPPPPDPEQERLEYLRRLARWCGPTEHAQQAFDAIDTVVLAWPHQPRKTKSVPPVPATTMATWRHRRQVLDECLERDRIQGARPPGCHCLGTGGFDGQVAITLWSNTEPPVLLYSEGMSGPMKWSRTCKACPEGQAHLTWVTEQRGRMKLRYQAMQMAKILGAARIPSKYERHTLANFPDQVSAGKVQAWYLRCIGEHPVPTGTVLKKGLYIHGPNRRGKTTLTIGVLKLALERGIPGIFRTVRELLGSLRAAFNANHDTTFEEVLQAYKDAPLLCLDDIGAERLTRGDSWVAEVLLGLLEYRETEELITIVNSNLGWTERADARRRRTLQHGTLEEKRWHGSDYDPEELQEYIGERLWWRLDSMSNKLPLFGDVLGYGPEPAPAPVVPDDEL